MPNLTGYVYNVKAKVHVTKCEWNEVVRTGEMADHEWTITVIAKDKYLADAFAKKQGDYYQNFEILSESKIDITAIIPVDYGLGPTLR